LPPRIAIPLPHTSDLAYSERALPQYERAIEMAGGTPVRVPLDLPSAEIARLAASCDGVLLPGSNADVEPSRFRAARSSHTAAADPRREAADNLLLEDAYAGRKPVLGICYGLQSLNVFRAGSLVQHIPDFLPEETRTKVNHEAGRAVPIAHSVAVADESLLKKVILRDPEGTRGNGGTIIPVNSSHHQSADSIGDGLRIVARCLDDGIIEALEGTAPDHFVLAVQWHPERSVDADEPSRAIFRALIKATTR
jgi:putative glutamine amidotransferase